MNEIEQARQTQAELAEEEINLLELLQVLVKRRKIIAKITLCVAVMSVLYSLTLKNIYTATATVMPPAKEGGSGMAAALLGQLGGLGGVAGGLGGSSDLYVAILKSRSVSDAVITRMDLFKEYRTKTWDATRNVLQGAVKFQDEKKSSIITISASNKDPRKAAMLANTFVEELERTTLRLNLTRASTERNFLEKRLTVVKQDLKNAENNLKTFQEQHKTINAGSQATAAIEGIARLKAEIVTKEVQLSALRYSMTDEAPEVKALLAAVGRLKAQLAAMSGNGGDGVIPTVGAAPELGIEYMRRLREFKLQEALFEQLSKQYELAKLNEAKDSSSLQVLDEAVVPAKKSKPKRSLIVILATVTAFFCSVFLVFIQEYLAKMSPEDAALLKGMRDELGVNGAQIKKLLLRWKRPAP